MTAKQIEKWNAQVDRNREIVRNLWAELGRKPTVEEMEAAISAAKPSRKR